ncbi:hypothetical protein LTR78_005273 [Recurvomyces mirabilis]|uniref:PIN domain-containing protein n=1 Tax=Recurvomyces mirabilis TaxID=574656 RepID=A0AAE0WNM5_9PEZI|nr:hypothetical protein LTR78_005273 [Recurvomyces mirabilis]KAK5157823.1 hypothetical protein LTS14_003745 [Recurvomyces mirabilis]
MYSHNNLSQTTQRPTTANSKMRGGARSRPVSQNGPQVAYTPANRKIFNCIVDDTALVAGVKRSTRNGIRQWVKNGQIRLFVPLYALEQLSRQKGATNKHGEDVRETLEWLDDATSKYPHAVTLQGGDQYYDQWAEVERFSVPRTLFSEQDMYHEENQDASTHLDSLPDATASKLTISEVRLKSSVSSAASVGSGSASSMQSIRSSISAVSPPTSPAKADPSPAKSISTPLSASAALPTASASVPGRFQPLFNYILWRIHQELDPVAALETFIFLCNDPQKVHYTKRFDIRSKRLEQLREAVGREDRDVRNRLSLQSRENQQFVAATPASVAPVTVDEDEVVYKPPPRAPATMAQQQLPPNVIDPNSFGRTKVPTASPTAVKPTGPNLPSSARGAMQNSGFLPRGNNSRGNFRGGRGRGNFARGGYTPAQTPSGGQIDPDSFERPRGAGPATRGVSRKLWVPT